MSQASVTRRPVARERMSVSSSVFLDHDALDFCRRPESRTGLAKKSKVDLDTFYRRGMIPE